MKKFQVNYIIFCLLFNKLLVHIPLISATLRKNNLVKTQHGFQSGKRKHLLF